MLKWIISFMCFGYIYVESMWVIKPGPKYPPTKGEIWPKPQYEVKTDTYYTFNPSHFKIKVTDHSCDILTEAIDRYSYLLKHKNKRIRNRRMHSRRVQRASDELYRGQINKLEVALTSSCEDYPHLNMDESYNLTVSATSVLTSSSIWGVIRGLETYAQLFYLSNDRNVEEIRINTTQINDFPRYKHRGLLIDTSRHFISVSKIFATLNAMAMNKMNVLHWHIVDDQSFPYNSEKFPELSEQGAYDSSMVYTKQDIERVVIYARDRGIRVIPEFDVPGHTASWGNAHPSILTDCYQGNEKIGVGPMDPIKNITYKVLRDLFQEAQTWFPDKYFHIGGDEVQLDCWKSNPELNEYMRNHNLTASELHGLFMRNVIPLLANNSKHIVWQEVFDEGVRLTEDTIIQVWKYNWINEMIKILYSGHKLIFSSSWYLDAMKLEWNDYYAVDPRQMVHDATQNETILVDIVGGEACMWGEMVDDKNIISRVWPRASAVAEKLWSAADTDIVSKSSIPLETYYRIEEHTCRMIRRGIDAQPPSGPGFCIA